MKRIRVQWRDKLVNMSLPASGVLTGHVTIVDRRDRHPDSEDNITLHLGGLDFTDGLHPQWGNYDLVSGDQITFSIHDDQISDPPIERTGLSEQDDEQQKKNYLRQTAKELGWELIEHEPKS